VKRGTATREKILDIAKSAVLAKGFQATSIDEIIAEAGITKSGFFYHFHDKNELARALVRRFRDQVEAALEDTFGRAGELTDDSLQRFLIGLKLFAELVAEDHRDGSGCIIASICYQERLFDREVMSSIRDFSQSWRQRFHGYLSDIAKQYELAPGVDLDDLSDMLACIIDGAIIMARVNNDHRFIERQVLAYRAQVRMAFPTPRIVVPQRPVAARPSLAA
jgi:TetR/AcrR family transcriptional repressor of nem operon